MTPFLQMIPIVAAAAALGACSTTPDQEVAAARPPTKECLKVTGSNICQPTSGNPNVVYSISGDDLRRSGGPVTGAQPGKIAGP